MDEIERLRRAVSDERLRVVAAAISAGATQYATLAAAPLDAQLASLDIDTSSPEVAAARHAAAADIAAAASPLYDAIRSEEETFRVSRSDPLSDAIQGLEEFVWLCWALVQFPPLLQPKSLAREIVGQLLGEACHVGSEVVYLMRAGFFGGAYARWRSIYGLGVYCEFISRFGHEAAVRFAAHRAVEQHRMAAVLREHGSGWGMIQLTDEERADIDREFESVRATYGQEFVRSDYGWAAPFLSVGKSQQGRGSSLARERSPSARRVTLANLEEALGMERWRAKTKVSSALLHGRLASRPEFLQNDSLNLRLVVMEPADGHVGALTALTLSSLVQVVVELSVDVADDANRLQAWFVSAAVEELRQQLDRKFDAAEDVLAGAFSGEHPTEI
jgi:hypothetical protein